MSRGDIIRNINQLKADSGVPFVTELQRIDTLDNPVLIIGIGGTGIDAMLRVKYLVNKTFVLPSDAKTGHTKSKPENIEFLAIETNEADRTKTYRGIGIEQGEMCVISCGNIGTILANRRQQPEYIREWLSPSLTINDGISGANGIRQAGRMMFFQNAGKIGDAIDRKITAITAGDNKKLIVYILCGVSGGTGSGCFIDTAYLLRGIMQRKFQDTSFDRTMMMGYLFLPDVNISNGLPEAAQRYCRRNGYAALKELEYLMDIANRGEYFTQRYNDKYSVDVPVPPFDFVHLISSKQDDGTLLPNGYDYCLNVASENIVTFLANEENEGEFSLFAHYSNIRASLEGKPPRCRYITIGAAAIELPTDKIMMYLAGLTFEKMDSIFSNTPKKEHIYAMCKNLGLDPGSVASQFERSLPTPLPGYNTSSTYSYENVIKNQVINIDQELVRDYRTPCVSMFASVRESLPGKLYAGIEKAFSEIFTDPTRGPAYASRMIINENATTLISVFEGFKSHLESDRAAIAANMTNLRNESAVRHSEACKSLIGKDKKCAAFIAARIEEYRAQVESEKLRRMIEVYDDLEKRLRSLNSRIYGSITTTLEELKSIFRRNTDILFNTSETVAGGNRTYHWTVADVPDLADGLNEYLDRSVKTEDLVRDFTSMLLERLDSWVGDEADVSGFVKQFLDREFGDIIAKSMEQYLYEKINRGREDSYMLREYVCNTIASELQSMATPLFGFFDPSGMGVVSEYYMVSVPRDCGEIRSGFEMHREKNAEHSYIIKKSNQKNRIFWVSAKGGIAMSQYGDLKGYEAEYEQAIANDTVESKTRHLYQNPLYGRNWVNLPSPIPQSSWGERYYQPRIAAQNAELSELFDRALKCGAISCVRAGELSESGDNSAEYICRFTLPVDISGYARLDESSAPGELKRAEKELSELLCHLQPQKDRLGSDRIAHLGAAANESAARERFIASYDLTVEVRREVEKLEGIGKEIERIQNAQKRIVDELANVKSFCRMLYTGTLFVKPGGTSYVFEKDGAELVLNNLLDTPDHPEYTLYRRLDTLHPEQRTIIKETADANYALMQSDPASAADRMRKLKSVVDLRTGALRVCIDEIPDGAAILAFYKTLSDELNALINALATLA